jgi:hypothetical protein
VLFVLNFILNVSKLREDPQLQLGVSGVWTFETRNPRNSVRSSMFLAAVGSDNELRQEFHVAVIASIHFTPDGVSGHATSLL